MVRFLYVRFLRMHPITFREKFAAEMLWIFDETAPSEGTLAMLLDCFGSLFRQWILRSGYWKIIPAFAGASLQLLAINVCWHLPPIVPCSAHAADSMAHGMSSMGLLVTVLAVATAVAVAVVVFWTRNRIAGSLDPIV
jgi:hypothetical protein